MWVKAHPSFPKLILAIAVYKLNPLVSRNLKDDTKQDHLITKRPLAFDFVQGAIFYPPVLSELFLIEIFSISLDVSGSEADCRPPLMPSYEQRSTLRLSSLSGPHLFPDLRSASNDLRLLYLIKTIFFVFVKSPALSL